MCWAWHCSVCSCHQFHRSEFTWLEIKRVARSIEVLLTKYPHPNWDPLSPPALASVSPQNQMLMFHNSDRIKEESNKNIMIIAISDNIGYLMKEKILLTKSVLWCSRCKIHCYVTAPPGVFYCDKNFRELQQKFSWIKDALLKTINKKMRVDYLLCINILWLET